MRVHQKNKGNNKFEIWIEDFDQDHMDWVVVSEAKCMIAGNQCLIDTIDTYPKYRNKGYAKKIVETLKTQFKEVSPIGIEPSAVRFWERLGMEDALGPERED